MRCYGKAGVTPILTSHSFDIITHSPAQTFQLGERLGRLLEPGDVICLQGELGSGKTCLAQGIGSGLRVGGTVRSPSFVLINEHPPAETGPCLYHVDLYRIRDASAALALGLQDYLYGDGVTVIEWAERARGLVPAQRLWVCLSYVDRTKRSLVFDAIGDRYAEIVVALRRQLNISRARRPG